MKIKVIPDCEEQKKRQVETWTSIASTLRPDKKQTIIKLLIASGVIAVAAAVFIVASLLRLDTFALIIGVIVLIVGMVVLSGAVSDVIIKKSRTKRFIKAAIEATDNLFGKIGKADTAVYEFVGENAAVSYLIGDRVMKKYSVVLDSLTVFETESRLTVDFNDTDFYCFAEEEIGCQAFEELKSLLSEKHESYQKIMKNDAGEYEIVEINAKNDRQSKH